MNGKSLIDLIEEVIVSRMDFDDNGNEKSLDEMLVSASEIADRLDITLEAACALAWVVYESSWGRQIDRQFLMQKFHEQSTIELRFRSLWILTKRRLVSTCRARQSPTTLLYYIGKDQCELVLSGKIETLFNERLINEHANRRITAQSCRGGSDDYNLLLDGVPCGYVFESINGGYEVFWKGNLVMECDNLSTILETLSELLEQHRLPLQ
jgi:hypothetical protein